MRKTLFAAIALLIAVPVIAQDAPPPPPSAEAEALGKRVAESGTLASLLPLMIAKDIEELVAKHPELDAAGKARLRATAGALGAAKADQLMTAVGRQYALRLSIADLRALAAFNATDAAKNRRAAEPMVIASSMKAFDGFDLKAEAWTAYCKDPASKCPPYKTTTGAKKSFE